MRDYLAYIECQCGIKDHLIVLEYDSDPDWGHMISIQARNYQGFWSRFVAAFKYVFFKKEMYWAETMIKKEDIERFKEWIAQNNDDIAGELLDPKDD